MLVRVILLTLLLLLVSDIQCGKIHKLLKSVGKRYGSAHTRHYDDNIALFKAIDRRKWESASEEQVNATKWQNAKNLVDHFLGVSSTENEHFEASFKWFEAILSADLSAEICEDGKKLNTFQYVKYMKQIASRYEKNSVDIDPLYLVMDTPKDTLQVFIQFEQKDKNGITVLNHFDFIMKESFVKRYNESIFSVAHISQGGSCLEHGKSGLVTAKQEELKEYLSSDPNGIHFLNYFSPRAFHKIEDNMFSDIDTNNLPNSWLMTISDSAEIKVCQGEESVEYTPDQFRSWYQRFGQMWHGNREEGKEEEYMKMHELHLEDGEMSVRLEMKLQIGVDEKAKVHDWNMIIGAKQNAEKAWFINKIEVLCPPTISNLMDENFLAYRDVFGATFNQYIEDRKQWYPATSFAKHFRKYGAKIEFMHCFTEITENEDMPKKFWIYDRFWNGTMIGYFNMYELTIPAAEDTYIVMRMKMKPPAETPVPGDIFGSDWKFYIKWDKMDQFYYFYKAEFSCPQYMKPGDGSFRVFSRHKGLGYYES